MKRKCDLLWFIQNRTEAIVSNLEDEVWIVLIFTLNVLFSKEIFIRKKKRRKLVHMCVQKER